MSSLTETPGLWRYGDGTNLIGVPPGFFGSADFNDRPSAVHIAGVREINATLFRLLSRAGDIAEAAAMFSAYVAAMFDLEDGPRPAKPAADTGEPRRYRRSSYLRLLRGWAYDSNSPEGAVLKGWVESRFGLFPTYHREPLERFDGLAWSRYLEQKMGSRFHGNAIFSQIDLLYEFAQWALERFFAGQNGRQLYRGVGDFAEHPIVERIDKRRVILRLNNLISFTAERDMAGWFGDCILDTWVPNAKILFFNELLPRHPLKGEGEVLVIGGDYRVTATYF